MKLLLFLSLLVVGLLSSSSHATTTTLRRRSSSSRRGDGKKFGPKSFVVSTNYGEEAPSSQEEGANAHVVSSNYKTPGDGGKSGFVVVSRTEESKHTHRIDGPTEDDFSSSGADDVRSFVFFSLSLSLPLGLILEGCYSVCVCVYQSNTTYG